MPIDLDTPAFGSEGASEAPTDVSQTQRELGSDEEEVASSTEKPVVEEEQKVPYSRFSSALNRAKEAEIEAAEARARYEELTRSRQEVTRVTEEPTGDLPTYWVKLYGDSEPSKEAYKYELQRQEAIEERAEQRALQAMEQRQETESRALSQNESTIDSRIEDLSSELGRDLTPDEESSLLDIVDEYTPKNSDGSYLGGDTIPFDKAWEIYELKQASKGQATKKSRNAVANIVNSKTDGEPTGKTDNNKNFNPMDWNAYKKRI